MREELKENQFITTAKDLVNTYVDHLKHTVKCTYCGGWGHHSKNCSTLHTINRWAGTSKTLKSAWGTIKGTALKKRILKAMNKGAEGRRN